MSETTNAASLLVGAGKVYFDRFNAAGESTGLRFLGNAPELTITPAEDEVRELYSSAEAARGLLARVPIRRKVTFGITLNEYDLDNLSLGLMGDRSEYLQLGTAVVDEIVCLDANVKADRFYKVAKRAISAITVKRGAATLVLNTDYKVTDTEAGIIYLITGTGTGNLLVSYTPTAMASNAGRQSIQAAKATKIEGRLLYITDNTTGPKMEVEVWKVSMSPNGDVGFIADEFGEIPLKGEVLTDTAGHPTEPYYRVLSRP